MLVTKREAIDNQKSQIFLVGNKTLDSITKTISMYKPSLQIQGAFHTYKFFGDSVLELNDSDCLLGNVKSFIVS